MGLNVNDGDSSYLDIYLSGVTAGWIAIGFSTSANMVGGWWGGGEREREIEREREKENAFSGERREEMYSLEFLFDSILPSSPLERL